MRYAIFAYSCYYPSGGWRDWKATVTDLGEAKRILDSHVRNELVRGGGDSDFGHVIELETGKQVYAVANGLYKDYEAEASACVGHP